MALDFAIFHLNVYLLILNERVVILTYSDQEHTKTNGGCRGMFQPAVKPTYVSIYGFLKWVSACDYFYNFVCKLFLTDIHSYLLPFIRIPLTISHICVKQNNVGRLNSTI